MRNPTIGPGEHRPSPSLQQGRKVEHATQGAADEFTYSVLEPNAGRPDEHRQRSTRKRTRLRSAWILDRNGRRIIDCLIHDRSPTGARLRLAVEKTLPQVFILLDEVSNVRYGAALVWQRAQDAGVILSTR